MNIKTTLLIVALSLSFIGQAQEPIQPIKPASNINLAMMELGKKLYFDPRLSKSGFISCNSCHNLSMGGTDNLPTSIGHKWNQGPINAPTVLNSSFNIAQFWDGRAKDLKEQAGGPIANPGEMASTHAIVASVVKAIPGYVQEFELVFGKDKINTDSITSAIAEFEKTLVTPHSPFDQWLLGDKEAISAKELAGYELFKNSGCIGCHNGAAVGGTSYQKMGIIKKFQTSNKAIGLAGVTHKDSDKYMFKVPTLRNIELTYPYFHDGATRSLKQAVNIMGEIQLSRQFTDDESDKIVAFLKTLTGDAPAFDLPQLPPSVAETPKPEPFK